MQVEEAEFYYGVFTSCFYVSGIVVCAIMLVIFEDEVHAFIMVFTFMIRVLLFAIFGNYPLVLLI